MDEARDLLAVLFGSRDGLVAQVTSRPESLEVFPRRQIAGQTTLLHFAEDRLVTTHRVFRGEMRRRTPVLRTHWIA